MDAKKRIELMKAFQDKLKEYHATGDIVMAQQAYRNWKELATYLQAKKAPKWMRV